MRPTLRRRALPRRHAQEMRAAVRRTSALPDPIPTQHAEMRLQRIKEIETAVHDLRLKLSEPWDQRLVPYKAISHLEAAYNEMAEFRRNFWSLHEFY